MLYIYFYLFTHVTESFVTERLVTESWGLLLAPPPYFSVSCLKRFPDTPRIYTMVLQGFISIVSLSPLLSNLHRRILRSAIIACALQKKILPSYLWIIINQYKDPYQPTRIQWKVGGLFFRGSVGAYKRLVCQSLEMRNP